ncbi:TolC family protein [Geojedonia litorea]|uniref:TolC family protein n=1 Tax=Geojedonia litorea TaxID=1268269 RepID=A0ABV9N075_9FLAO
MKTYNTPIVLKSAIVLCSLLLVVSVNAQDLQTVINEALENNPEIQKFELKYGIAKERVNEVNALPNSEIGLAYFVSEPETRTGAQRARLSLRQMIPWFGTITARENYMASMADAQYEDVVISKRRLMLSVAQSYYNLYALQAKQAVLLENHKLLKTYKTLALTSVEVGKASAVAVLRLQMRQNELQQLIAVLEQEYLAEQTTINNLLNREEHKEIEITNQFDIPDDDTIITNTNLELHPELLKYNKLYQSVEQSELLNQKERAPMLGFGLDYTPVANRTDMNPIDNGKDILMPMVTFSIPLFNKSYKSKSKQNQLKQQEIEAEKLERLNMLKTRLDIALKSRASAKITYNTQLSNLKQAKDAERILIRSYETGTIDFNDVLDIQELQLKFQMNQIEAVKGYYIQTTIINYLTN